MPANNDNFKIIVKEEPASSGGLLQLQPHLQSMDRLAGLRLSSLPSGVPFGDAVHMSRIA